MITVRMPISFLAVLLGARLATAQPAPGQNVQVKVDIASVVIRGDTIGVSSTVTNLATSQEKLFIFLIDAPTGVVRIDHPTPVRDWVASRDFGDSPTAHWAMLDLLPPGATTPALYFASVGIPGIVTYWAGGYFPLPEGEGDEPLPDAPHPDPRTTEMINGRTVGVKPWPTDRTPRALIARLRALTQTSCSAPLNWIASPALCTKLIGYLDQAEANRAAGKITQAKSAMNNYVASLSGKTAGTFSTGVTNPGYWLLRPNADIIIAAL